MAEIGGQRCLLGTSPAVKSMPWTTSPGDGRAQEHCSATIECIPTSPDSQDAATCCHDESSGKITCYKDVVVTFAICYKHVV